jgi:hypothetical protein
LNFYTSIVVISDFVHRSVGTDFFTRDTAAYGTH